VTQILIASVLSVGIARLRPRENDPEIMEMHSLFLSSSENDANFLIHIAQEAINSIEAGD
jgi:hypothetical protein